MRTSRIARITVALLSGALVAAVAATPAEAASISIKSFSVSPAQVSAAGGKLTFKAKTTGATSCTLRSSVSIKGLPATFSCASGSATKTVTLPGAASTSNKSFLFSLTASTGSLATTAKVTVTRLASAPAIGKISPSVKYGPSADTLRISTTVKYAKTCTLSASPAIAGLPSSVSCSSGAYAKSVTLKKNTGSAPRVYTVKLTATSATKVARSATVKVTQKGSGTPLPTISAYSINPSTLTAAGGTYTVKATVKNAKTCTLKVTPTISTQPAPASCTTGSYSKSLTIPANTGTAAKKYTFTFTATNSSGSAGATITATQPVPPPPAPSINNFKATPATFPAAGGSATVSATIAHGSTCTLTSTPMLAGLSSSSFACTGTTVSRTVTVPANSNSTTSYVFTLKVTGPGGVATGTLSVGQTHPIITSYSLSPSSVSANGGTFTVNATTADATSCTFSTNPDLGAGTSADCSGGTFSQQMTIQPNTGSTAKTFTLTLVASASGGGSATATSTLTIKQPPAPPAITSFTSTPSTLTSASTTLALHATFLRAKTCALTSSPAISGSTASFDCTSGTFSRSGIAIPANTTSSEKTYTFTITANGDGGSANNTLTLKQPPAGAPASPTIDNPSTSGTVDNTGGTVTLKATIANAANCTLTSTPTLGLSSTAFACNGSWTSQPISIPANTGTTTQTYKITLTANGVTGSAGPATAVYTITVPPAPPTITNIATSGTVDNTGGTVTLSATVANSVNCTLGSSPSLGLSSATFTCNGNWTKQITIPANTTTSMQTYTITLTANGASNSATATYTVTVPPAPQTVAATSTSGTVDNTGGTVTLKATIANSTNCTLASSPSLGLSSATFACNGNWTKPITMPANTGTTTQTYTITLTVNGPATPAPTATYTINVPPAPQTVGNTTTSGTVDNTGGTVTIGATITNSTGCTITSSPSLNLTTSSFTCNGNWTKQITVPANTGTTTQTYTITLTVNGPASPAPTATYTIKVPPAPQSVANPTISSSSLGSGGGPVTLGATIANATNCTLASTPSLGLSADPFACNGNWTQPITIPANNTTSTQTYTITLTVNGPATPAPTATYTVNVSAPAPTASDLSPSPSTIPSSGGALTITSTIANGSTCTFTPDPIVGSASTSPCGNGTFTYNGTVPANTGAARQLSFTLKITNSAGSQTKGVTITQLTASTP